MKKAKEITLSNSVSLPLFLVTVMWLAFIVEFFLSTSFHKYGIYPKEILGLKGVIFSPFIHGDYKHLVNNTLPIFILSWALKYFYRNIFQSDFLHTFIPGDLCFMSLFLKFSRLKLL